MKDLRAVRRAAEVYQGALARHLGMTGPYLSLIEKSTDVTPTPEFVARWLAAVAAAAGEKR
jgi:transcriptional regulator with XRE-family HTH domain